MGPAQKRVAVSHFCANSIAKDETTSYESRFCFYLQERVFAILLVNLDGFVDYLAGQILLCGDG
jgi:hypothetical protein